MSEVDSKHQDTTNGHALARACVRRADTSEPLASADGCDHFASGADLERVAELIENAPPKHNETVASIIAQHPQVRRAIVAAAVRALGAKKWWYDAKKKRRVEEPDYALSFKAAEFLADRVDGKPAQAVMALNMNADVNGTEHSEKMKNLLDTSPGVREAMRRVLDAADKRFAEDRSTVRST